MKVNQAYRYRSVEGEHGTWGNETVESMLEKFPWLTSLVVDLRHEANWPKRRKPGDQYTGWVALFFEDHLVGRPPLVSVSFALFGEKGAIVNTPSLPLFEDKQMALADVEKWTKQNIRRASR